MTRHRKLLILLLVAPLALVAALVVAVLTPAVQTFAARKALAGQGEVGRLAIGAGGAEITALVLEQPGVKITVPRFKADIPVLDAARGTVDVRALVARDIVIDYDPVAAAEHAKKNPTADDSATPSKPFDGLLKALELPGGLQVNGLDLAGVLHVRGDQPLDVNFALTGGGVTAGKEGRIELKLSVKADKTSDVATTILVLPTLDAGGQLSALALTLDATAKGGFLTKSTSLRTEATITREGSGEAWKLRLLAADKELVEIDTQWAPGAASLPGRWKLDLSDGDLKPFIPLFALPSLKLAGAGELAVSGTERLKISGDLNLAADALETLGLPALGPVSVVTKFDVDANADEAKVNSLRLDVAAGDAPVLAVEARQAFGYALATGKLSPATPSAELLAVRLLGLPSAWIAAFVPDLALGAPVSGAWSVRPEGDGVVVDTIAPLVLTDVRYGTATAPLAAFDSVQVEGLRVRQGSAGLDAAVEKIRLVVAGADVVAIKVSATQKTGEALLARAEIRAQLATLADQPALRGQTRLSAGQALLTLEATVDEAQKVGGQLRLSGLRAIGQTLPEVLIDITADRTAAGVVVARVPITVSNAAPKRISDLELSATFTPGKPDSNVVAKLVSQVLHLPDLEVFAGLAAETVPPAKPVTPPAKDVSPAPAAGPLWAGITGELDLSLARIVYAPGIEVGNTTGRLALTRDAINLEKIQTLLGTGGKIDVTGALRWLAPTKSYTLAADVKGADVAVGPLLKALDPAAAVPLEGTYGLSATVAGAGVDPAAAASTAEMNVNITGKQGVLRALNLDANKYAKAGSTVAGFAGLLGAVSGNPELAKQGARVTALNNVARQFSNLPYDELTLTARRGADGAVEIGQLRLSSPQLSLQGSGALQNLPGRSLTQQPLNLKLDLGARDALAQNLDILGLLEPLPAGAEAGAYAKLTDPVVLDGTLSKIGTQQLMRLLSRALGGR